MKYSARSLTPDGSLEASAATPASGREWQDEAKQPHPPAESTPREIIAGVRAVAVPGGARNGSQWMRDRWVWGSLRLRHFATCSRVRSNSLARCARRPPSDSRSPPSLPPPLSTLPSRPSATSPAPLPPRPRAPPPRPAPPAAEAPAPPLRPPHARPASCAASRLASSRGRRGRCSCRPTPSRPRRRRRWAA